MKTRLTLACLVFSVVAMAQVNSNPISLHSNVEWEEGEGLPIGVIPKSFSYDGTNRVYLLENNQVSIYSNSFSPVRSFSIEPSTCNGESRMIVTERKEAIGKTVNKDNQSYTDGPLPISYEANGEWITTEQIPTSWTLADIIAYLANNQSYNVAATAGSDGTTIYLSSNENDYFKYDTYARQYPETYWALENNQLIWHRNYYYECNTFSDTWTEYSRKNDFVNINIGLGMFDYDDGEFQYTWGDNVGLLTQTLFNEDAQYEYIHFLPGGYKLEEYGNEPDCGDCHCDDEYLSRNRYYHARCGGFEIVSETGNALCSVTFPSTVEVDLWYNTATLIKLDNKYYICISANLKEQGELVLLCYRIERNNSGAFVQQVSAPMPIAAYPSPANRNQTITINLNGDNKTATELQVVNMNGQVLDRRTIPAGQQQTTIPASHFAPGTNLINATQNGQPVGTTRVIVK